MGSDALSELAGKPRDWIKYGRDACRIDAVIATKKNETRKLSLEINKGSWMELVKNNEESLQMIDRAIAHAARNCFIVGYGTTRKLTRADTRSAGKEAYRYDRAQSLATLFDPDASLHSLESWAMDLDYRQEDTGL